MDLVVYGAGGMGRELMWQISVQNDIGYNLLGFIDDSAELLNKEINGFTVIGNTEWLLARDKKIAVAIAVGDCFKRREIVMKLKENKKIYFPNFISENVFISPFVEFGEGNIICNSSIITTNIKIGDFMLCNRSCNIGHDAVVGNFVTLNPGVIISGNVTIGDCVNIGTGTNVIQNKTIGNNSVIGAGAVVSKDIPADCTAVGVPAKPIKFF